MFKKIVSKRIALMGIMLPAFSFGLVSCKDSAEISSEIHEMGETLKSEYKALQDEFGDTDFASEFAAGFKEGFNGAYNHEMPDYGSNGWNGGQQYGYGYGDGYGYGHQTQPEVQGYRAQSEPRKSPPKKTTSEAPAKKGLFNLIKGDLGALKVPGL